jgi:hypothetical protein
MTGGLAVHTSAPLLLLADMVRGTAHIEVGKAAGTGQPDCFYGWAETAHEGCKPHHIITDIDEESVIWIGKTLAILGHQVVVTAPDNPRDPFGDHHVVEEMPVLYDWEHSH